MKPKRGTYPHAIRWIVILGVITLGMHVRVASSSARPVVIVSRGDPDEPEAPTPGLAKTGSVSPASASMRASRFSYATDPTRYSVHYGLLAFIIQILRLRF